MSHAGFDVALAVLDDMRDQNRAEIRFHRRGLAKHEMKRAVINEVKRQVGRAAIAADDVADDLQRIIEEHD